MTRSWRDVINLTRIGNNDGGAQTACSFLRELAMQVDTRSYCVVAFQGTSAGRLTEELGFDRMLIPRTIRDRLRFDFASRRLFGRGQLCFTFHGAPWFGSRGHLVNVSGVADWNLYYPEIDFWRHCAAPQRVFKQAKDRGRMFGYSWADFWVFETDTVARRAIALAGYPEERVAVVKMSVSTFVSPDRVRPPVREGFRARIGDGFALLFMCGPNPNKRIVHVAPAVAAIRKSGKATTPVKVVTTLSADSEYYGVLRREFDRLGVADAWVNLGPVAYDDVPSLIDACDVVCLFSVLESFSSNFTEAWAMGKPLLVSDADWARMACGKAAMYVEPTDADKVADAIVELMDDRVRAGLLSRYADHYRSYPTPRERCSQYLACMERARRQGPLASRRNVARLLCGREPSRGWEFGPGGFPARQPRN